jgi:phosphate transport system substrate-binding protein
MPPYKAASKVSGTIRMFGSNLSGLVVRWEEGFSKLQPEVKFTNNFVGSDAAITGLDTGDYDMAPNGREANLIEYLSFSEAQGSSPFEVTVGTGAYDIPGRTWAPIIFVSKDNPLTKLTMKQLDGIFGAERTGGMEGYVWEPRNARSSKDDIRTWGQLGLTGEWKDKPIQTYGYAPTGMSMFFQLKVLHGNDKWNPNYREYVESNTKMVDTAQRPVLGSHNMLEEIAGDKYGIGWSGIGQAKGIDGLKPIALASKEGGPYVNPSLQTVADRSYPLTRSIFIYLKHVPGQPMDLKFKEFLLYVLSSDGQKCVEAQGQYLPLTPTVVADQRKHLE